MSIIPRTQSFFLLVKMFTNGPSQILFHQRFCKLYCCLMLTILIVIRLKKLQVYHFWYLFYLEIKVRFTIYCKKHRRHSLQWYTFSSWYQRTKVNLNMAIGNILQVLLVYFCALKVICISIVFRKIDLFYKGLRWCFFRDVSWDTEIKVSMYYLCHVKI